jgi:hypothetical protein
MDTADHTMVTMQNILDSLDIHKITADFAGRSDIRKSLFGNGPF